MLHFGLGSQATKNLFRTYPSKNKGYSEESKKFTTFAALKASDVNATNDFGCTAPILKT